jgi:hypothetical protein
MGTFSKKKESERLLTKLPLFLGGPKCRRGMGPSCRWKHFLDQVFNPHIWDNNDWIWAFFSFHG